MPVNETALVFNVVHRALKCCTSYDGGRMLARVFAVGEPHKRENVQMNGLNFGQQEDIEKTTSENSRRSTVCVSRTN